MFANMRTVFVAFLVAFCFVARSCSAKAEEPTSCKSESTCRNLKEEKANAVQVVNKAVEDGVKNLNKIREDGEKARGEIEGSAGVFRVDEIAGRELMNMAKDGNEAFEKALKEGKELGVFQCISECESSARKEFPPNADQFKKELKSLQEGILKKIDAAIRKASDIENNVKETRDKYVKQIASAISVIGVKWKRDEALKSIAKILKNAGNLGEDLSGMLREYNVSAQGILKNCETTFARMVEEARKAMEGCFQEEMLYSFPFFL